MTGKEQKQNRNFDEPHAQTDTKSDAAVCLEDVLVNGQQVNPQHRELKRPETQQPAAQTHPSALHTLPPPCYHKSLETISRQILRLCMRSE